MVKKQAPTNIVGICEEIILSFNPTTHSIDTHVLEKVGDTNKPVRTLHFDVFAWILITDMFCRMPGRMTC